MLTSISFGYSSDSNVSWVPQRGQKLREACSDERNRAGSPCSSKLARGTVSQATNGAPVVPRQIVQWQQVSFETGPALAYLTNPQKQPPATAVVMGSVVPRGSGGAQVTQWRKP